MEKSVKAFFWERETLKSWGVGILAELAGLGLFCVSEMNIDIEFYDQYYLQFSVAALLLAIILNALLDYICFSENQFKAPTITGSFVDYSGGGTIFVFDAGMINEKGNTYVFID